MDKSNKSNFEIKHSDEGEYLWASISGPWDLDALEEFIINVRKQAARSGCQRALVDALELQNPSATSFKRFVVGEIIAREWGPYIKVAAVAKPENMSRYVEDTAVNRGANFAVFSDVDEARVWLFGQW